VREWLGGRAVQHPVGLPLVELLHRLQEDDGSAQRGDEPVRRAPAPATTGTATPMTSSVTSNRLKTPLRGGALAVVPVELVHQPPPGRVVRSRAGERPDALSSAHRSLLRVEIHAGSALILTAAQVQRQAARRRPGPTPHDAATPAVTLR
jgi:hypothetical protein